MSSRFNLGLTAALFTAFAIPALADGDAANGEKVFRKCAACHAVEPDGPSRVGPNLHDVVGRATASVDFAFSDAMKKLGEEGHIWTAEELDKYLENPRQMVPGTKMAFVGLRKPEERADVIAYLASLNPDGAAAAADAPADAAADAPAEGEAEAAPAN